MVIELNEQPNPGICGNTSHGFTTADRVLLFSQLSTSPLMHVYTRARVPIACLTGAVATTPNDPRLEPWRECDITVDGLRIIAVAPHSPQAHPAVASTDLGGALVWPGFIDAHTHLDKTHTWERAPNPTGEFWDAVRALGADNVNWSEEDVYRRASFALKSAWAHGTVALRSHIDTGDGTGAQAHAVLNRLREEWAGRIAVQTVSLCGLEPFVNGGGNKIMELTARYGATALGGFPQPNRDLPRQMDYLMAAARELGIGLDLHVDESNIVAAECLRATAEAVLRNEFPHSVVCGHACSLAVQPTERALDTIRLVKEAGIGIISLPLCNIYLQDRTRRPAQAGESLGRPSTPRWRGLTLLHELVDAGVEVACASDNVRDAFYAWGDYDVLEVYRESVRLAHLDTRLAQSPAMVTTGAAAILRLPGYGLIAPGSPADLVVLPAQSFNELLARPTAGRRLIRGESFRQAELPGYSELI